MSNDTFYIGQNDRVFSITRTLAHGPDDTPIDLSDAVAVTFQLADLDGLLVASGPCTITDAANGVVRYDWASGDTATPGRFQAKFIITWPGDLPQTVPNTGTMLVVISEAFTAP